MTHSHQQLTGADDACTASSIKHKAAGKDRQQHQCQESSTVAGAMSQQLSQTQGSGRAGRLVLCVRTNVTARQTPTEAPTLTVVALRGLQPQLVLDHPAGGGCSADTAQAKRDVKHHSQHHAVPITKSRRYINESQVTAASWCACSTISSGRGNCNQRTNRLGKAAGHFKAQATLGAAHAAA